MKTLAFWQNFGERIGFCKAEYEKIKLELSA
jgi:hypothetical protein